MRKNSAFTLVELMIVMTIIAILATAGLQAYTGYMKKSRDTARASMAQNLNSSVMAYAASNGGNPPSSPTEFKAFLASAAETVGGSSYTPGGNTLIKDPVGGKDVCLDAVGNANQPCRFDYTAYKDGTYAISYGVETEAAAQKDFYKTTQSVPALTQTIQKETFASNELVTKYGVFTGSAPFIGSPATKYASTEAQTAATTGVDDPSKIYGGTQMASVLFSALRMDVAEVSGGGIQTTTCDPACTNGNTCDTATGTCKCGSNLACTGNETCVNDMCADLTPTAIAAGGACTQGDNCVSGYECSSISSTCQKACMSGTIRAEDDRCWYPTNLPGFYQWGRKADGHENGPYTTANSINTQSSSPTPGNKFIRVSGNWYTGTSPAPDDLWTGTGTGGVNNPCPSGSHVPTKDEWDNFITKAQAKGVTDLTSSLLQLPKAGYRHYDGIQNYQGDRGYYWSTTPNDTQVYYLGFRSGYAAGTGGNHSYRALGLSVRCIQD